MVYQSTELVHFIYDIEHILPDHLHYQIEKKFLYNLSNKPEHNGHLDCRIISILLMPQKQISLRVYIMESGAIFDNIPLEAISIKNINSNKDIQNSSFDIPNHKCIIHKSSFLKENEKNIFCKINKMASDIIKCSYYICSVDFIDDNMNGHLLIVENKIVFKANYEILILPFEKSNFIENHEWPKYKTLESYSTN
jgi:hypothetical protein